MNQKFAKYFVDNSTPVHLSATRCIVTHGYMCNGTSITVMTTFRSVKHLAGYYPVRPLLPDPQYHEVLRPDARALRELKAGCRADLALVQQ